MERDKSMRKASLERIRLADQSLPAVPLIEIVGHSRVLIEGHRGVTGYESTQIRIKTKDGCICVCGERLQLSMMCREKLVITGKILSVNLQGRG